MRLRNLEISFVLDNVQARLQGDSGEQVNAREIYRLASEAPHKDAIRFWGCFTNGGCDKNLMQYWVRP